MPHSAIDTKQFPEGVTDPERATGDPLSVEEQGPTVLPREEEAPSGFLNEGDLDESPTTISNATVIEDTIPDMEERLDGISDTGAFTDPEGVQRFADGQPVPEVDESAVFLKNLADFNKKFGRAANDATGIKKTEGGGIDTTGAFDDQGKVFGAVFEPQTVEEAETDQFEKDQDKLLADMKANLDDQTKRQIDSIEALYTVRRAQLKEINKRAGEAVNQSLLIGGSSRFAPISSTGIQQAKETSALLAISQLDAEEKSLINEAKQAQITGDFKLLGVKLELAEIRRAEKLEAAKALNEIIAEENKKIKEKVERSSRDSAITNLVAQGVTDPIDLLEFLNFDDAGNTIGDFTAEEVSDVLGFIKTAEEESFSFEDLGKINQETGLDFPIGTTQSDLIRAGIVPRGKTTKDFTYKTIGGQVISIDKETNEARVIFQGKETEDPFTTQQRFQNTFGFQKEQTDNAKDFIIQRNAVDRISTALGQNSPAGDLAAIFAFMKAQDPNSVVRESEFATAAGARAEITRSEILGFPIPTVVTQGIKRLETGERLTDAQQKDFLDTAKSIFNSATASQVATQAQARIFANLMGLDPEIAVPDQTQTKVKLQQNIQPGEIIVWSINDNEAGFIPIEEYEENPSLYLIY